MKDSPIFSITELDKQLSTIKIAFLDVGQGDTIVISRSDTHEAIVVDCIDAEAVLEYLSQEKILHLRGIIVTHLHNDHYSQVDSLIQRFHFVPAMGECEKLAFRHIDKKHPNYENLIHDIDGHQAQGKPSTDKNAKRRKQTLLENLRDWFSEENAKRRKQTLLENLRDWFSEDKRRYITPNVEPGINEEAAEKALPLSFKGIKGDLAENIYLIHPFSIDLPDLEVKGLNNTSVVLRVTNSSCSALLTGDLEPHGWAILQKNYSDLRSDILKFPHHGGTWSASDTRSLLDTVQPSVVVISVGTDGEKYKHPNKEVLCVLSSPAYSHIRVLCTQATNQCQASMAQHKQSILQRLDTLANSKGNERIGSKHGCPCAGTVIVELGDEARVLQPTLKFHQDDIIRPHFLKGHKCTLK